MSLPAVKLSFISCADLWYGGVRIRWKWDGIEMKKPENISTIFEFFRLVSAKF